MDKKDILKFYAQKLNDTCVYQIILIDKKTIFASSIKRKSITMLELSYKYTTNDGTIIFIPLNIIAGISFIDYTENLLSPLSLVSNKSSYDLMLEESLIYAESHNFETFRLGTIYDSNYIISKKLFKWGDLTYKSNTALYADWNYLQNVSGGLNCLGAGIGIFSLSGGWSESLWNQFQKKVQQRSIEICNIDTENDAVVKGYIHFIKHYTNIPYFEPSIDIIEMEGSKWIPAIISTKRNIDKLDNKTNSWALMYLKQDGLMFPLKAWEKISNTINVYCEVVHVSISTEFGTIPFYLKARCAAYIKD